MPSNVAAVVAKLNRAPAEITSGANQGIREGAALLQQTVRSVGASRGVNAGSDVLAVGTSLVGGPNPSVTARMTNRKAPLLEGGSKAHRIEPRGGLAIVIPGVGPRAYAKHPGSPGKHIWSQSVQTIAGRAPELVAVNVRAALMRVFGAT